MVTKEDLASILGVSTQDLVDLPFLDFEGVQAIDERDAQKFWYQQQIPNAPLSRIGSSITSFDELILRQIVLRTYPKALIEPQYVWGRRRIDLTGRFRADRNGSFAYFYGPNTEGRVNPEHPIIDQIRQGKRDPGILLPRGYDDPARWLPDDHPHASIYLLADGPPRRIAYRDTEHYTVTRNFLTRTEQMLDVLLDTRPSK